MKRSVVLLVDADADTASTVLEAARMAKLDVRFVRASRDLFQLIQTRFEDVAAVVLDVDSDVHGMAVLEALDAWGPAPPVIVISSLEEAHLEPVVLAHGAQECLGKPVSLERLAAAISKLARSHAERSCRCDKWGHPCPGCTKRRGMEPERPRALFAGGH